MNTGALRHLVTLDVPNGSNGYLPLDPADWRCASLGEPSGTATFVGRFHPGITTATRIHFKGRTFHVDTITVREDRDRELILNCREVFE